MGPVPVRIECRRGDGVLRAHHREPARARAAPAARSRKSPLPSLFARTRSAPTHCARSGLRAACRTSSSPSGISMHSPAARVDVARVGAVVLRLVVPALFPFVETRGREGIDIRARMFAPAFGIPEDPATGSAAAALAGYLAARSAGDGHAPLGSGPRRRDGPAEPNVRRMRPVGGPGGGGAGGRAVGDGGGGEADAPAVISLGGCTPLRGIPPGLRQETTPTASPQNDPAPARLCPWAHQCKFLQSHPPKRSHRHQAASFRRSRLRYCIASLTWTAFSSAASSRSAIVRAILSTRW